MMKMNKLFISTLVVASLGLTSCESDDSSNRNPIENVREAKEFVKQTLVDSEYGWVINFFPSKEDTYGGYYLWMDFAEDWTVDVRSDFRAQDLVSGKEEYNFVTLSSFALSFPVQGKIHQFIAADPETHHTDIEFLYYGTDGEDLAFKGHTTGNIIKFRKATKALKDNYMGHQAMRTKFNSMKTMMLFGGAAPEVLTFKPVANGDGRMFNLNKKGYFADSESVQFGVSCGSENMVISQPIIIDGVEISEFVLVNGQFVGEKDGKKVTIF